MTAQEMTALAEGLIPVVRDQMRRGFDEERVAFRKEIAALEMRILELETRPAVVGPAGEKGATGATGATGAGIASLIASAEGRLLAHTTDGRTLDAGPLPIGPVGPPGAKGDAGVGEPGPAGKDAPLPDLDGLVTRVLALMPLPEKGERGEPGPVGQDGAPGLIGKDGAPGLPGKDGVGQTGAFVDRTGHLILTLSDGTTKDVGIVVGKDGADGLNGKDGTAGANGRDVDMSEVTAVITRELATWPRPKDGQDGRDGVDGLGIDDADLVHDQQRGWFLRLLNTTTNRVKDLAMPFLWDANVWVAGATYPKGAGVTWDGQFWIAQKDTSEKPAEGLAEWRLAVRRGGRGKDGRPGKDAPVLVPSNTPPLYGG